MAGVSRNPRPLFVTALPAGYDGQEVFYQSTTAGTGGGATDTMATVGAVWHLRYRSASASSYKWEFVGGAPTNQRITTAETQTAATINSYTALATDGPKVKVPLAGDYLVRFGARFYSFGASQEQYISIDVGATAASGTYAIQETNPANSSAAAGNEVLLSGVTALDLINCKYQHGSTGSAPQWDQRHLTVTPIRVG